MQPKGQIFQQPFSCEQLSLLFLGLLFTKKGTWKFDTQFSFHHKFQLIIPNQKCKIILNISFLRVVQWRKKLFDLNNVFPLNVFVKHLGNYSWGNLVPFSLGQMAIPSFFEGEINLVPFLIPNFFFFQNVQFIISNKNVRSF